MDFDIDWHSRLGSSNAYMKDLFTQDKDIGSGRIIAAREQTAGRGRQDRSWISAPETNLCFSLFVETHEPHSAVSSLTMAVALAIAETLNAQLISAAPKWPNDVLVGGRKICGILSERVQRSRAPGAGVIVGIGLNVNMSSEEAEAIDRPATSMLIESGKAHDLNKVLESLFPALSHWIGEWERSGFSGLREVWTEKAGPIGKRLSVHDGDILKSGRLAGFGECGELLLETEHGLETIWSGDIS